MSNRAYLYSLSNRPKSYADRPDTISGLSEFPYFVPFSYRLLMSGDPQLCSSLVADGFESDTDNEETTLYAISSNFEAGFARLQRFFAVLRPIAAAASPELAASIDETITFLEAHRDRYLLLETIELDTMEEGEESALRACVEKEIENCLRVGAAVDALPDDLAQAAELLKRATQSSLEAPFDAFYGLHLDDDYDSTRLNKTEYPLGLAWDEVLYFELMNRSKFETSERTHVPLTKSERFGLDGEYILNKERESLSTGLTAIDKLLDFIADITKNFPQLSFDTSKLKTLRANYVRGLERIEAGIIDGKAREGTSEIIREAREWIDSATAQLPSTKNEQLEPNAEHILDTQREALGKGLIAIDKTLEIIADITKKFPKLSYDTSKLKTLRANYVRGLERLDAGVIDGKAREGTSEMLREAREWMNSAVAQIEQSSPASLLTQFFRSLRNLFK